MALRRNISTPPEDDWLWAAAERVSDALGRPLSRVVADALREYPPLRVYLAAQADELTGLGLAVPVDNHG